MLASAVGALAGVWGGLAGHWAVTVASGIRWDRKRLAEDRWVCPCGASGYGGGDGANAHLDGMHAGEVPLPHCRLPVWSGG